MLGSVFKVLKDSKLLELVIIQLINSKIFVVYCFTTVESVTVEIPI